MGGDVEFTPVPFPEKSPCRYDIENEVYERLGVSPCTTLLCFFMALVVCFAMAGVMSNQRYCDINPNQSLCSPLFTDIFLKCAFLVMVPFFVGGIYGYAKEKGLTVTDKVDKAFKTARDGYKKRYDAHYNKVREDLRKHCIEHDLKLKIAGTFYKYYHTDPNGVIHKYSLTLPC